MILDRNPDADLVRGLFTEYGRDIGVPITDDPSLYSLVLVAMDWATPAGCAALRSLKTPNTAEVKRLYVCAPYRGTGLGRRLARAIIDEARQQGYRAIRLDTLPQMRAAIAMYGSLGFQPIPAYHANLLPGMLFFELTLISPSG